VFVTTKAREGLPSLRSAEEREVILQVLRELNRERVIRITEFSIQHDHLHLTLETRSSATLSRGMSSLSIRIARRLNKLWGRRGRVWNERFHALVITSPRQMRNVLRYCLNNGRKHGAWLDKRKPDPYSSGIWFDGWANHRCLPRDASCPAAPPCSWLATIGWRASGPLPLAGAPAA